MDETLDVSLKEIREAIETCCPDHARDLERFDRIEKLARLGAAVEAACDGTSVKTVGPVAIACMKEDARDLLDHMMEEYKTFCGDQEKVDQSNAYSFAYWLCRYSGIIAAVKTSATRPPAPTA